MKSGITVNAQRPGPKGGPAQFTPCDICDLSEEEFAQWWISITDDRDKFYVANTLRKMTQGLSDFGDEIAP